MKEVLHPNGDGKWSRRGFVAGAAGLGMATVASPAFSDQAATTGYVAVEVPLADVDVTDSFWSPRIEKARTVALPDLLRRSAGRGSTDGRLIEAASYFLAKKPDAELKEQLDALLDGTIASLRTREHTWVNRGDGSTGQAGTFFEGAIAYHDATGSRKLLDVAIEVGDDLDSVFGPGKRYDIANHEGVEIGLIKLYRATGNDRYLKLAKFMVDVRGTHAGGRELYGPYAQDQAPVKDQPRAIGHCVRATYLYNAVTDLGGYAGDTGYAQAAVRIWEDAASKRTYLTGGIGTYRHEEDYGDDYDLPNLGCWNEICAAVGNTLWDHRLFLLTADSRYIDLMERVLYNGLLAGMSLDGKKFLYQTPLKAFSAFERQPFFGPNCCPPNITRLLAQFGRLIYARQGDGLYVNLFVGSQARVKVQNTPVTVVQDAGYPWQGNPRIVVNPISKVRFPVMLRVPGWARNEPMPGQLYRYEDRQNAPVAVTVNGSAVNYRLDKGYARIDREWVKGDVIEMVLPMPVRRVRADDRVLDDRGMVALERGPVVFCAEGIDNHDAVFNLVIPENAKFQFAQRPDLLEGAGTIHGTVLSVSRSGDHPSIAKQEHELLAIPFYAFGNRQGTEMAVWLPRDEAKAVVAPTATIASTSRATSSCGNGTVADDYPGQKPPTIAQRLYTNAQDGSGDIRAICDQIEPVNSEDESNPYLRLRPQSGDQAWVQYDFDKPAKVSSVSVYWKDDKQYCVLPQGWRLMYRDGEEWKPVSAQSPFGVEKDKYNRVAFAPVTTAALRIEIRLQPRVYKAGLLGPPDANWMREDTTWYEGGVIEWRVNS